MPEQNAPRGVDYRRAAELTPVLLRRSQEVPLEDAGRAPRPNPGGQGTGRRPFQPQRPIGLLAPVDKKLERDLALVAEVTSGFDGTHTDRGYVGFLGAKLLVRVTQLRDVLPTKSSAVVAKPGDNHGMVPPQIADADVGAVGVRKGDVLDRAQIVHSRILEVTRRVLSSGRGRADRCLADWGRRRRRRRWRRRRSSG